MKQLNFQSEVKMANSILKPHAMRLTRDLNDAEDLIQETIVRALTNEDKFQEGDKHPCLAVYHHEKYLYQ
jgi:DNA-directed RNA polymerase specialized sigma24 family protein